MKRLLLFSIAAVAVLSFSGCIAAAAGAAVGYGAHKEGYRVRNPVTR
ncbi:MAG: hypothetical protein O3A92_07515 [Verrucomicrobia bacterium]|nr:hypothetical protein [Verrucomicrobiota bacterium]